MRIILHIRDGSDGLLALRAAKALIRDGYGCCVYGYGNRHGDGSEDFNVLAKRTKTGVSAWEPDHA